MSEFKTIVFPVDFSGRSASAAPYVATMAATLKAGVKLIHVIPPPSTEAGILEVSGPMLADVLAAQEAAVRERIRTYLAEELKGTRLERLILKGDPAREIVAYAATLPSSLIVMPTHGYGPFRRFILGSITTKVLHDAKGPVLTGVHIEQAVKPELRVKKVLAALDLEGGTANTLRHAATMSSLFGAKLLLCHVSPSIDGEAGELFDPNWRDYFSRRTDDALRKALESAGTEGEIVHAFGDPAKQIGEVAEAHRVDLIVIGRSHDTVLEGRLRTHAYSIIRTAPCPVLSV